MNRSGKSVRGCFDYYDLECRDVLVIFDDIDLPVGRLKIARNGGAGGHKGVQSIIHHLGSREFPRFKIGIGRPRYGRVLKTMSFHPSTVTKGTSWKRRSSRRFKHVNCLFQKELNRQ